jgi:hypothetical protein
MGRQDRRNQGLDAAQVLGFTRARAWHGRCSDLGQEVIMAHAITHDALDTQVDEAVATISRDRARKKTLAIGSVLGGVLVLLGATYAMYTYSPGKAPAGQVGTETMKQFTP